MLDRVARDGDETRHPRPGHSVTRVDLVEAARRSVPSLGAKEAQEIVSSVFREMTDCLVRGEDVKLSSFGVFVPRRKTERVGRNPKTGVEAVVPEMTSVTFRASNVLKAAVNGGRETSDGTVP